MTLKRILFVDDEPMVLQALGAALRKQRQRWEMVFVNSAELALAELVKAHYDAVVSDMRMPQMDGAALLAAVKRDFPGVARIILSGHAEQEAVTRVMPVAHRFLQKPCKPEVLCDAIERAIELQSESPPT